MSEAEVFWMVVATAILACVLWRNRDREPRDEALDRALEVVEASLDEAPDEWSLIGDRVTNRKRKVSIWLKGGTYGLGIRFDGKQAQYQDGNLPIEWKTRLYNAGRRVQARLLVKEFRK